MDLVQLRHFQAVARHQHVSRAAAELGVAQPALSRSIARLEAELGVPLFDRRGRRVELNRFGSAFLIRVSSALDELDQARRELDDAAGRAGGTVAVAAETLRPLTEVVAGFLAMHSGTRVRLVQSSGPAMPERLRTGEVDLCIASQPLGDADLDSVELLTEEVLLAVPPEHPLAGRGRIAAGELAGVPFVAPRPGYWQRTLADRLMADVGLRLLIACEGEEPGAIRGLISAGVGVGLLPAIARRTANQPSVGWLRLIPETTRTLRVVWRRDRYLAAAVRLFIDSVRIQAPAG